MKKQKKKLSNQQRFHLKEVVANNSYIQRRIAELQDEIDLLENVQHNNGVDGAVKYFRDKLIERATPAELKFKHIAELKGLKLRFQHRIDIVRGRRIEKVYYADFCDVEHKIIFETDGGYHSTPEQQKLDILREKNLKKAGYKIFRISNEDVFNGKTCKFLYDAYKSVGILIYK